MQLAFSVILLYLFVLCHIKADLLKPPLYFPRTHKEQHFLTRFGIPPLFPYLTKGVTHCHVVINGVSLLETELGNGQAHHVLVINFQAPAG